VPSHWRKSKGHGKRPTVYYYQPKIIVLPAEPSGAEALFALCQTRMERLFSPAGLYPACRGKRLYQEHRAAMFPKLNRGFC